MQRKTLVMHLSTVIKWYYISKDNDSSHRPIIVGEKHEISLLGFINLGINEQEACDFPEDLLRNWATHVYPPTVCDHVDRTPPLLETLLTQHATIIEPTTGNTWTLKGYPLLLHSWGAI